MKKLSITLSVTFCLCAFVATAQNVGIGNTNPQAKLDIIGNIKITDGTEGAGKVLTSNATGAATWQALSNASLSGGVGFGAWGDCNTRNISGYNPVAASDAAAGDYFGAQVSISGNYAIVGASSASVGANANQGKAYIFFYNGTNWVQQAMLTAGDGAAGDRFGFSVSINGNYAIVGAYSKSVGSNLQQGKAYVFYYNGASWVQQAMLTASDGTVGDNFGISVSINGNYAVIGAYNKKVGANLDQGKAYVFNLNGTTWVQQAMLTASDGVTGSNFGSGVSISGNYVIVGAPAFGSTTVPGKAYIFVLAGTNWFQIANFNDGIGGGFGFSASISGNTAVVGTFEKSVGTNVNQGKAYILNFNGSNWVQQAALTASDAAANDNFGIRVSINGNNIIIGAYSKTINTLVGQGAAYIYQNINGFWLPFQKVTNPVGAANNNFGIGVGIDGGRFVIGESGFQGNTGMAHFGKMEL